MLDLQFYYYTSGRKIWRPGATLPVNGSLCALAAHRHTLVSLAPSDMYSGYLAPKDMSSVSLVSTGMHSGTRCPQTFLPDR